MSYLGKTQLKASDIKRFNVTSSTSATHTLTWVAPNEQSLIITINGVKQHEDSYSISGVTLTLTSALIVTDKLEVIGILDIGEAVTPPDDSISTVKIKDDAVTAAKLANSINTEITANTAKVTNATHTGDVTGATALTIAADAVDIAMLSATGTADATTFLRGDNAWASAAAGLNSMQTFTSSGTWTKPSGITKVIVHVVGAGGGGGGGRTSGSYPNGADGAGAGGLAIKFIDVTSVSTSTITVGAAGSGGAADSNGTSGGNSIWSDGTDTLTGSGGNYGGAGQGNTSWAGGAATRGTINSRGGGGENGYSDTYGHGGRGGVCANGFGGGPGVGDYNGNSNPTPNPRIAQGYGHGGAGGNGAGGGGDKVGGAGAAGIVVIWEYK